MVHMVVNETRKLYGDNLRQLCIEKNWYTRGTNEDYGRLLLAADTTNNVTARHIADWAEDIREHSDTDYDTKSICFEIAAICNSFFDFGAE